MSASVDRGQGARLVQLLAALLDRALIGEVAQHALQFGAIGILQTEGARDLARAGFAGMVLDEGEQLLAGGEGMGLVRGAGQDVSVSDQPALAFAFSGSFVDWRLQVSAFTAALLVARFALGLGLRVLVSI